MLNSIFGEMTDHISIIKVYRFGGCSTGPQVGALFEDQKILKPFLGVAESHGLVKALEMVLLLVKEEQLTTDQKPVASNPVSKKTEPAEPPKKAVQPTAKPQNMGMFSPQTVTLDD